MLRTAETTVGGADDRESMVEDEPTDANRVDQHSIERASSFALRWDTVNAFEQKGVVTWISTSRKKVSILSIL
jgi:hypothetical protein